MDMVLIFWMVILILCIVIEVLTLGLTTIWFAAGALVAIFAALLYAPIFVQVILFLLVSLTLLFFTRPIAVKYFNRDRVKTNVESMVGRQAIVTGEIDNVQATGQVTVSGQEWSARSWDDKVRIPAGAVVVVVAISGVKLIVRTEQRMEAGAPVKEEAPQPMAASPGEEQEAPKEETRIPGGEPQVPEAGPEEKEPEVAKTEE
ncbi:NfeD family protein [uncultured Acetatifactor sp.]|uniref:NfeD family protein n=1 Tax=uncultured Acetatifactor sp. TaxID=1671927 RepID=UPI002ED44388